MKVLGREPMQWLGLISAAGILLTTALPLSVEQQGAINAAIAALVGFVGAVAVSADKAAPLVAGLVQAVLALGLAFGVDIRPSLQSAIMAFVAATAAWWLRTQVTAPVPAAALSSPRV